MKEEDMERLAEWLFRPSQGAQQGPWPGVYALLDGARDQRIFQALKETALPTRCLFAGRLDPALQAAAPYLVELKREEAIIRLVLSQGWGDAWGIFVVSSAPLEALRRHFRRFLQVVDERGKHLFFRYYDPRVLRIYLPTCNAGELATIFGPVTRYMLEAEDPDIMLEYSLERDALITRDVEWRARTPAAAERASRT